MEAMLEKLSATVAAADTLDALTRPLLEMLQAVTGLESTYLTSIDLERAVQSIMISHNTGQLQMPEGLTVPWSDTLCKRCLEQGLPVVSNVAEVWGDSQAAAALGIQTYASAPVRDSDGQVIGTLCAASQRSRKLGPRARSTLNLFSKLIAQHIERERLLEALRRANERLTRHALTDSLTELPNRRALRDELGRLLARAAREGSSVVVGIFDLDGFKEVNDQHGHLMGDVLLRECALRLSRVARDSDMLARIGGDEFAVVGPGPAEELEAEHAAASLAIRAAETTAGIYSLDGAHVAFQGVSAGVVAVRVATVDEALELADAAMYRAKRSRQKARHGVTSGVDEV
ncbi:GGDEF domain-containing protein [Trinickia dinghuensis]|uniref:Sensor domain-containing diguanylate cyclase n=1 Tax=Trinickia dinghuensis TaxID=2291023 RepID=A0A3D8K717_9BURK|nr:sensor domain-containing diguanylate cyclase [Trinickia dinghuensis]RDV00863.1 sensor domain-containing diguanylate cyclase [Trinickia dinghuensis]